MQTTSERRMGARPWAGPAMMFGSALSNQFGAATGALAFGVIGPAGVVAVRQWIAGIVLLAVGRPRWRTFSWAQRWPVLLLALAYGTMNLSLYSAIARLGLGLAMTLEFLGPLAVALAASRRRADLISALVAGAGVVVLTRPRPATDYLGIGLGLLAAACWAAYILLNRLIGRRLPGTQGSAAAAGVSALAFVPAGLVVLVRHPPTAAALACAGAAGILSSAVPLLADLLALRRVPAGYFGIFMSINPVLAAVVGLVILRQSLSWGAWLSIGAIVAANAVSAAIRLHGEDHGRGDDGGTRDPGRAQPLPQQQGGQDGAGQGLEQGQQHGRARRRQPQAAEEQRVGHGGRPGAQRDQQADGRGGWPEAETPRRLGQRHQGQPADGEAVPGHGEVVEPWHRPGTGKGDGGEARRREHGHTGAGQDRGFAEPGRKAHEQAEAGHRQDGGGGREPAGRPPGRPVHAEHDDRGGADRDQGGQRHRGQRHGREVATLVERGQQADHANPGPGRPAGRPAPAGRDEEDDDQRAADGEPVVGDGSRGQAGGPAEQAAGEAARAPQQAGCHQEKQASAGAAAGSRGPRDERMHRKSLLRREGKGRGSGAGRNHPDGEHAIELAQAREARVSPLTGLGARGLSPR